MDLSRLETLARELFVENAPLLAPNPRLITGKSKASKRSKKEEEERKLKEREVELNRRDRYLQRVEAFNIEFGKYIRVELVDQRNSDNRNKNSLVVRFNENPEKLARRFVELGEDMDVKAIMGQITYSVSRGAPDYDILDLFLPTHLKFQFSYEPFNPEKNGKDPTMIRPNHEPNFLIELMKRYVRAQIG